MKAALFYAAPLLLAAVAVSQVLMDRPVPQKEYDRLGERLGVERWPVKVTSDLDVRWIVNQIVPTSVEALRRIPRPAGPFPNQNRVGAVERTPYQVIATVTRYKRESDGDVHLVLVGESGQTMVAEIPQAADVPRTSRFYNGIAAARSAWDAAWRPTTTWKFANVRCRVTGIGFWDFKHGQIGMAPNGIELHPVIGVQWPIQ